MPGVYLICSRRRGCREGARARSCSAATASSLPPRHPEKDVHGVALDFVYHRFVAVLYREVEVEYGFVLEVMQSLT